MKKREIVRYFHILSQHYKTSCRIILTGAALGAVYGGVRATFDVDFALKISGTPSQKENRWREFAEAVQKTSERTGIVAQYAEDIDRWSLITYLDYEKHTRLFKRFGSIELRVLEVPYWAIGKLTRYLDPDIRDLIQVLKKTKTPWRTLTQITGTALCRSPKSTACFLFRKHVEDFLKSYGPGIWGKKFIPDSAVHNFYRHAKIKIEGV